MAAKAFREAAQNVEDGYSMIIFPEGTRSRDNEVHEFKAGAFKIAQRSHATVVPFCIDGTDSFFERNGHRINPKATLRLKILPPLDTSAYTRDDWKALPALCETQVRDSLGEMRISESN
jgi:1-acyl-sn-glycerol-3-phosphate acyltransferase